MTTTRIVSLAEAQALTRRVPATATVFDEYAQMVCEAQPSTVVVFSDFVETPRSFLAYLRGALARRGIEVVCRLGSDKQSVLVWQVEP